MIYGIFHQGSGLGNQLHRYVATRVKAADLGMDWSMIYDHDDSGKLEGFKGQNFMNIGPWNKGVVIEEMLPDYFYAPSIGVVKGLLLEVKKHRFPIHSMLKANKYGFL